MRLEKLRKILQAIADIVSRGEHFEWCGLTHISNNANLNRQTVWRWLAKLEKEGMVYKVERTWRGETAYRYYMTKEGKKFLSSFRKLDGLESVTK
jgi:predicted transcriptional regulator